MLKLFISAVALVGTTCAYGLQIVDSAEGQNAIRSFKVDGQQLFFPNAETAEKKKAG